MAYAFNKMEEYLRGGRRPGAAMPGSASKPQTGATLPMGGATAKQGTQQATNPATSTGREILERSDTAKGGGAYSGRILKPAFEQAQNITAKYGEGGEKYKTEETQRIKETLGTPTNLSGMVTQAEQGKPEEISKYLSDRPYTPTQLNLPSPEALEPTEYMRSGNIASYLQKQSGGRYTPGMGLIDQMYAESVPNLQGITQQWLGGAQKQVENAYAGLDKVRPELETLAQTTQQQTQAAVRKAIQDRQTQLQAAIDAAIATAQAKAAGETEASRKGAGSAIEDIVSKVKGEAGISEVLPFDFGQYMTPETVQSEFTTPEIGSYNQLAALLGGQGIVNPTIRGQRFTPNAQAVVDYINSLRPPKQEKQTIQPTTDEGEVPPDDRGNEGAGGTVKTESGENIPATTESTSGIGNGTIPPASQQTTITTGPLEPEGWGTTREEPRRGEVEEVEGEGQEEAPRIGTHPEEPTIRTGGSAMGSGETGGVIGGVIGTVAQGAKDVAEGIWEHINEGSGTKPDSGVDRNEIIANPYYNPGLSAAKGTPPPPTEVRRGDIMLPSIEPMRITPVTTSK